MSPKQRIAIVQGASGGIGASLLRELLERNDHELLIGTSRDPSKSSSLAAMQASAGQRLQLVALDGEDEASVARAARQVAELPGELDLLINTAGVLQREAAGIVPEKKLAQINPHAMQRAFAINALTPLLMAKHFTPLFPRHPQTTTVRPLIFANLSARVGSIGDNRLGGWYAYRMSKAALNMATKNLAIELRRTHPQLVCVNLHPGTVNTELSKPFQRNVPAEKLFAPQRAARQLLGVLENLGPSDNGAFLAWDGSPIPW